MDMVQCIRELGAVYRGIGERGEGFQDAADQWDEVGETERRSAREVGSPEGGANAAHRGGAEAAEGCGCGGGSGGGTEEATAGGGGCGGRAIQDS